MTAKSVSVTAGVTAAAVPAAQGEVLLRNLPTNAQTVWVGGSDVAAGNGVPLYPNETLIAFGPGLYVCTAASTADVRVLFAS